MTDAWGRSGESPGTVRCPQGHANSPNYKFCSVCGAPIGVVPFPAEDETDHSTRPTRRRIGLMIGILLAIVVVWATAATAFVLLRSPAQQSDTVPGAGGFGSKSAGATPTLAECDAPPILEAESLDMTGDGLVVGAAFFAGCPGDDVEAGIALRVTVADGERDIAAGEFDFSASPVEMKAGVPAHRTLVFPDGMYWRTPDMVGGQPTLVAHRADGRNTTPVASKSADDRLVAGAPAEPEHGSVDGVAKAVLAELRDADYPYVQNVISNRWVPQVSSKRAGLVVDGRALTTADVLRDHLDYRQRYSGTRLVYSGQWSTFSDTDWWVTVVGPSWYLPDDANRWCDLQGFGVDDCFAKFVSSLFGPERTTVYRK